MNLSRKIKNFFFKIGYLFLFMVPVLMHAQSGQTSFSIENGKSKIIRKDGTKEFKIEYEGKITLNDQDTDIIAVSRGGYINISKSAFGSKRKVMISNKGGELVKKYYVGNSKTDFEPEGRKWLSEILLEVVRSTTIGAESRVDRFYRKGGANGVLSEIEELEGDYVKSEYFDLLLKKDLNSSELARVASTAGEEINSDHYLAEILKHNQKAFLASNEGTRAYMEATKSLGSDHYQAEVLKAAIRNKSISDANLSNLLEASKNLGSDHYKSEVYSLLLTARSLNSSNIETVIRSTGDMSSDHYRSEILKKVLKQNSLSEKSYNTVLEGVNAMDSDHYKGEVLNNFLAENKPSDANMSTFLNIAGNMKSDHYLSEVMKRLASMGSFSDAQLVNILGAIGKMDSDHYITEALKAFAGKTRSAGNSAKEAYRAAAKNINSTHYYGVAMKAID